MCEKVKPIVFINNIDEAIFDPEPDGEKFYQKCVKYIKNINEIVFAYEQKDIDESWVIDPIKGNVAFG